MSAYIQTALNVDVDSVKELTPGAAIIVSKNNDVRIEQILPQLDYKHCSFERIYFSRGSDRDVYLERKSLGRQLTPKILEAVDGDLEHTIFSFIPNTAEVAYMGMVEGLYAHLEQLKLKRIMALDHNSADYEEQVHNILHQRLRTEKIAIKDIKLRTFITEGNQRNDLAAHVYDVTYGQVQDGVDNLVVIDDSIVRGTTLRQSIIRILDRLHPRRIVIVSSSPQVRFPDYYGIDMRKMSEFIAFRAAIQLLKERKMQHVIDEVYARCKAQEGLPKEEVVNHVVDIYAPFTDDEVSQQIARMVTSEDIHAEVKLVYQSVEGMHNAIPTAPGDWYFTGDYPTPGGNKMVNQAYINWYENN